MSVEVKQLESGMFGTFAASPAPFLREDKGPRSLLAIVSAGNPVSSAISTGVIPAKRAISSTRRSASGSSKTSARGFCINWITSAWRMGSKGRLQEG